jgi:hypothetical protein
MENKGFNIPDHYFEQKKESLKAIAQSSEARNPNKRTFRPWYAYVAAALVIIGIWLFRPSSSVQPPTSLSYSELKQEEVIQFLVEDPNAIYPESFIQDLPQEALDSTFSLELETIDSYLNEQYLPLEYL